MNKNFSSSFLFLSKKNLSLKGSKLAFTLVLLFTVIVNLSLSAQCERIRNGVFPAPATASNTNDIPGWTAGGGYANSGPWSAATNPGRVYISSNGLEFRRDAGLVTTLEQDLTDILPSSKITISGLYWYKTGQTTNARGVLTLYYNGVVYATIDTTSGTTPTITVSNNAATNRTALPTITGTGMSTPVNVTITLPASIARTGKLLFSFQAGSHADAAWDIGMKSVSIVNPGTIITQQPSTTAQTVCQGADTSSLSVAATGTGTLTYQWYSNTTNTTAQEGRTAIAGATSASFTPPTGTAGTLYYHVIVTGCNAVASTTSPVTVNASTAISAQPIASQTVCENSTIDPLRVTATGTELKYQWYRNTANKNTGGTAIGAATTAVYTPPATAPGTLYYYVVVTGTCGAVTSTVSTVSVNKATAITTQPVGAQSVCQNAVPVNLTVAASGSGSLTYQWFSNNANSNSGGTAISGATAASYQPETTALGTRYYYVEVKGCNTVSSAVSSITVASPPAISAQPYSSQTVKPGVAPGAISVVATGTNLSYQWYNAGANNSNTGGVSIAGATSSSFAPPSSATVGTTYYYAVISGGCQPVSTATSAVVVACTDEVSNTPFSYTGGAAQTITMGALTDGLMFDIYTLDNSFTLTVNGTPITSQEIDFQSAGTANGINVRFEDGTAYENGAPSIFNMTGNSAAPIVRVMINKTGEVRLYGSKSSGSSLLPLVLIKSNTFNKVSINTTAANTLVVSQAPVGPTLITGRAYGVKTVPCVCYNDPNTTGTPAPTRHGITLLKRAGAGNENNWPMNRNSAFTALESNTRGFVITRMATSELSNITAPQDGMMVYDTTENCLKIYTVNESTPANSAWKCYSVPSCP